MKWHHSLYWRIAVGFVACLALLLVLAIAAWRHLRQAVNLQPIEALR